MGALNHFDCQVIYTNDVSSGYGPDLIRIDAQMGSQRFRNQLTTVYDRIEPGGQLSGVQDMVIVPVREEQIVASLKLIGGDGRTDGIVHEGIDNQCFPIWQHDLETGNSQPPHS